MSKKRTIMAQDRGKAGEVPVEIMVTDIGCIDANSRIYLNSLSKNCEITRRLKPPSTAVAAT